MKSVNLLEASARKSDEISKRQAVNLYMTSQGGDVAAAMKLGRFLRSNNGTMFVEENCASACVLVLAGAVSRWSLFGNVVIHRPYRVNAVTVGMEEAQRMHKQRSSEISAYLAEMNVPTRLLDEMLAVPSQYGRNLSESEKRFYLLHGDDPAWDEENNAQQAKKMGISMTEYLRRLKRRSDCHERLRNDNLPMTMNFEDYRKSEYSKRSRQCDSEFENGE